MLQKGKDSMAKKLVIVESPHKSKTIEKYLGSEYKVVSSVGHIRDLSTSGKFGFGVDIDNNFKPDYQIIKGKNKIVKELGIDESGYRVLTNIGKDGGQTVPHMHFHILGGKELPIKLA